MCTNVNKFPYCNKSAQFGVTVRDWGVQALPQQRERDQERMGMARAPRRRLPPSPAGAAGKTQVEELELQQFASRLLELRIAQGFPTQSALAREIWGEQINSRGYREAKNRDRISAYEAGRSWPDEANLVKLVKALDTTREYLAPDIVGSTIERQNPEFAMTTVAGHSDKTYLKVNKLVPKNIATMISQLMDYVDLLESDLWVGNGR
jgi:transcriptional regulator with XRE-family HTH domain